MKQETPQRLPASGVVTDWIGVDVAHLNRQAYDDAQLRFARGEWTADPSAGLILGSKGLPLSGKSSEGYVQCKPTTGSDRKVMVHRVLWEYVHGLIPDGMEINHINGVKDDNRLCNLELVTHAENMKHARETGLQPLPFAGVERGPHQTECQTHGVAEWVWRKSRATGWCRACERVRASKNPVSRRAA